jgi:hypothetical protein
VWILNKQVKQGKWAIKKQDDTQMYSEVMAEEVPQESHSISPADKWFLAMVDEYDY